MPLFDVTHKQITLVSPKNAENYEVIVAVKKRTNPITWLRMVKTVDESVSWAKSQGKDGKLVWTKSAALFGETSKQPLAYVTHLWDNVIAAVGDDKNCLKAVGGLLRWRISLQEDNWLVYRRETDDLDPDTGKVVSISEYWINNDFVVPTTKSKEIDINALKKAWGLS